jgi:hypothetical protein
VVLSSRLLVRRAVQRHQGLEPQNILAAMAGLSASPREPVGRVVVLLPV